MTILERRSSRRIPAQCQIGYFHLPPSVESATFRTLDLSASGACLEAPCSFIPGASLAFHLVTPDHQVMDIRALIVHTHPVDPTLYHIGVRFTKIAERDRVVLQHQLQIHPSVVEEQYAQDR